MIKLSDYVMKFLETNDIRQVFMLSGGGSMHLVDSLGKSEKLKYICTHHEQASAMAAEAYSKMTNKPCVVLVTCGPGATNTITGLVGAFQDSVPCIFLSGQAKRSQTVFNSGVPNLRQFGVQEVNVIPIVESITKYAVMINEPKDIKFHLEKSLFLTTSGRPGPVWLDIPLDVQAAVLNEDELQGYEIDKCSEFKLQPDGDELNGVVASISIAKRPVIICGRGVRIANAIENLDALVDMYDIPVVTPFMGIDILNEEHKNYIGRIGTKGTRAGNFAMQNADLIICIGSRLSISAVGHEYDLFARAAKIIVIDIDPQEHKKKTIKIDTFINSDAKSFLQLLIVKLSECSLLSFTKWLSICNDWKNKYPVCLPEYANKSEPVSFYYFVDQLTTSMHQEIPLVSDAGSAFYIVSQAAKIKVRQRYITSGAIATMGFNLPAAIGVSVAIDRKQVVVITGEGSFQQNIQELQTIIHHSLPIKIFVINNGGYLSIRQTQKRFFKGNLVGEGITSGVSFPDNEKISIAYGLGFYRILRAQDMNDIIETVLQSDRPCICEVNCDPDEQVAPTNMAEIQADGTMKSKPLEDMYPFLNREEFKSNMLVEPV